MTTSLRHPSLRRSILLGVVAAVVLARPAMAQTAERPDVKVGDRWRFAAYATVPSATPNRTWLVTSVGATDIEGTENGEPLRLTRELNVVETPRDRYSNARLLAFPLAVGKRWEYVTEWTFKAKGSAGRAAVVVTVHAYEKVTVPAGAFDAFRLVASESLSGTSPAGSVYAGETNRTYWYAPAARAIVKSVSHNPYLGPSVVELVGFEPGP